MRGSLSPQIVRVLVSFSEYMRYYVIMLYLCGTQRFCWRDKELLPDYWVLWTIEINKLFLNPFEYLYKAASNSGMSEQDWINNLSLSEHNVLKSNTLTASQKVIFSATRYILPILKQMQLSPSHSHYTHNEWGNKTLVHENCLFPLLATYCPTLRNELKPLIQTAKW